MNRSAARYKSKLKKKLPCGHATKAKLLEEFSCSLDGFLEEHPEAAYDDLCLAFGPPDEMAAVLREQISEKETRAYGVRKNVFRVIAGAIVVLVILAAAYILINTKKPIVSEKDLCNTSAISEMSINRGEE